VTNAPQSIPIHIEINKEYSLEGAVYFRRNEIKETVSLYVQHTLPGGPHESGAIFISNGTCELLEEEIREWLTVLDYSDFSEAVLNAIREAERLDRELDSREPSNDLERSPSAGVF